MYNDCGEMLPTWIFEIGSFPYTKSDLNALIDLGKVKVIKRPFGFDHDFFGVVGKKYPMDWKTLLEFRQVRDATGDQESAREIANCVEL